MVFSNYIQNLTLVFISATSLESEANIASPWFDGCSLTFVLLSIHNQNLLQLKLISGFPLLSSKRLRFLQAPGPYLPLTVLATCSSLFILLCPHTTLVFLMLLTDVKLDIKHFLVSEPLHLMFLLPQCSSPRYLCVLQLYHLWWSFISFWMSFLHQQDLKWGNFTPCMPYYSTYLLPRDWYLMCHTCW